MKRRFNKTWVFLLLAVAVAGLLYRTLLADADDSGARLGRVKRGDLIQRVTIGGNVVPERRMIIMAPYDGYVKKLYVRPGQTVRAGEPIVSVVQSLVSPESVFPIRAPYGGRVVQVPKAEGEFVKAGDPKEFIARIDDLSHMHVQANVPEIELVRLKIGQEAVIRATSILDRSYKGIVREISLAAVEKDRWSNSQNVEFPVRVEVLDFDESLKPGMSTLIDIVSAKRSGVLMLEHEFIAEEDGKHFVTLKDGTRRDVEVGLQNEQAFEILKGLNEGDDVRQIDFLKMIEE